MWPWIIEKKPHHRGAPWAWEGGDLQNRFSSFCLFNFMFYIFPRRKKSFQIHGTWQRMNCLCPKITMLSNQSCAATMWLSFSICVPFIQSLLPLKLCGNKLTYVFFVSFVFLCRWFYLHVIEKEKRSKLHFQKLNKSSFAASSCSISLWRSSWTTLTTLLETPPFLVTFKQQMMKCINSERARKTFWK